MFSTFTFPKCIAISTKNVYFKDCFKTQKYDTSVFEQCWCLSFNFDRSVIRGRKKKISGISIVSFWNFPWKHVIFKIFILFVAICGKVVFAHVKSLVFNAMKMFVKDLFVVDPSQWLWVVCVCVAYRWFQTRIKNTKQRRRYSSIFLLIKILQTYHGINNVLS